MSSRQEQHALHAINAPSPGRLVGLAIRWDTERPVNIDKALYCIMLAAAYGVTEACEILGGYMGLAGYETLRNMYYERVVRTSFIAQCELGLHYLQTGRKGDGVSLLRKAAGSGDAAARRALESAVALDNGFVPK